MRGQIIEKAKGVWLVRIESRSGQRRKSVSKQIRGTRRDAEKFLTKWLREMDRGVFLAPARQTLNDLLDAWLEAIKARVKIQTFESYASVLRNHVRPRIGDAQLAEIRIPDVQRVVSEMQEKNFAPRTIQYAINVLKMAFLKALEWDLIAKNPCQFVELPKKPKTKTRALTPEQIEKFLEACDEMPHGLIYELAFFSGCRPSEYLALTWDNVSFEQSMITVCQSLVWNENGARFDDLKNNSSHRTISLPNDLMQKLRDHRRRQAEHRLRLGEYYQNLNLVFATELGTPHHYRNLAQRAFAKILKKAELDKQGFTPYSVIRSRQCF